jgi:hypothetical protein
MDHAMASTSRTTSSESHAPVSWAVRSPVGLQVVANAASQLLFISMGYIYTPQRLLDGMVVSDEEC